MIGPRQLLEHPWFIHLGWALVHFLWQGTLVAGLLALTLRALRKQSAEVRYATACGAMVLMAALPAFTLAALVHHADSQGPSILERAADLPAARGGGLAVPATQPPAPGRALTQVLAARIVTLANQSLPWLVVTWAIGATLLLARLVGGWVGVARARREAVPISNWVIRSRLIAVSLRMGIPRTVRLLESAYVTGPAVLGVLKPTIIFPIAALTGLWPIQVEAILAHELAHIRRHDYLVNLVQSVVETLLFYHPAVWWVSTRIRQEREHCCDDMAVQACGNNVFYATALADLDDLRMPPLSLAVAATGGALLPRIRRLVMPPPNRAGTGGFWAGGALAGVLLLAALAAGLAGSGSVAQAKATARHHAPTNEPGLTLHDMHAGPLQVPLTVSADDLPEDSLSVGQSLPPIAPPAIVPEVQVPQRARGVSPAALVNEVVAPDDQPGELATDFPRFTDPPSPDVDRAPLGRANGTVVMRREFHRSAGNPAVAIPMSIPSEIVAFVRRDSGYWPLGATSIHATPSNGGHVILTGKTNNLSAAERGWAVQTTEKADSPAGDKLHIVGMVRLCIDPGLSYSIPFDVEMLTQTDPRLSGQPGATQASVTWFAPSSTRAEPLVPAPQPVVQSDVPDLMLRPLGAGWSLSAAPALPVVTREKSDAVKNMAHAGLATPPGSTQGLVQRNNQPLIRDFSKTDQKN